MRAGSGAAAATASAAARATKAAIASRCFPSASAPTIAANASRVALLASGRVRQPSVNPSTAGKLHPKSASARSSSARNPRHASGDAPAPKSRPKSCIVAANAAGFTAARARSAAKNSPSLPSTPLSTAARVQRSSPSRAAISASASVTRGSRFAASASAQANRTRASVSAASTLIGFSRPGNFGKSSPAIASVCSRTAGISSRSPAPITGSDNASSARNSHRARTRASGRCAAAADFSSAGICAASCRSSRSRCAVSRRHASGESSSRTSAAGDTSNFSARRASPLTMR